MNDLLTMECLRELITRHDKARPNADEPAARQLPKWRQGVNTFFCDSTDSPTRLFKFCRHHDHRVDDICEREELISLLGKVVRVPVVDAWVVDLTQLADGDLLRGERAKDLIRNRCVVMPFLNGTTVKRDRERAAEIACHQPARIADLFAFMHWVGDEDRGLEDILVVDDRLVLIDNGLCGPGNSDHLRGAHPFPRRFQRKNILKKCYPKKPSLVAFVLRNSEISLETLRQPSVIGRITSLSDEMIETIVRAAGLNDQIASTLISRRDTLENDYHQWLDDANSACSTPGVT